MYSQQEVRQIVRALCSDLAPLFPQDSMEPILFGSYARGDADPGSDIDVLILVDTARQDISDKSWLIGDIAAEYLIKHGVVISPIVENKKYFASNAKVLPFYRRIAQEGVRFGA